MDVQQSQFEYLEQAARAGADDYYICFYGHFQPAINKSTDPGFVPAHDLLTWVQAVRFKPQGAL
jgi:hypothetical protein